MTYICCECGARHETREEAIEHKAYCPRLLGGTMSRVNIHD